MFDVITIGAMTRDVFLTSGDFRLIKSDSFKTGYGECFAYGGKIELNDLNIDTGGGASNAALTFKNFKLRTSIHTRLGDDLTGKELIIDLKKDRIDTSNTYIAKGGKSAYSTILSTESWDRTILVYRGVAREFSEKNITWKNMKSKWFYISSLAGNLSLLKKIFTYAKKNKINISWNPGSGELAHGVKKLSPFINQSAIFTLNKEEAQKLVRKKSQTPKKILKTLGKSNAGYMTITDGAKGAYAYDGEDLLYAGSLPTKVVNTTGAGDAFCSGLTAGIILKDNLEFGLRLGSLNAANVIRKIGAKNGILPKIPTHKELKKVIITTV